MQRLSPWGRQKEIKSLRESVRTFRIERNKKYQGTRR